MDKKYHERREFDIQRISDRQCDHLYAQTSAKPYLRLVFHYDLQVLVCNKTQAL